MNEHFDSKMEVCEKLILVTVQEQLWCATEYQAWKDAGNKASTSGNPSKVHSMKRINILNRLPYWKVCNSNHKSCILWSNMSITYEWVVVIIVGRVVKKWRSCIPIAY